MSSQLGPTGVHGQQGPIGPVGGRGPTGIFGMTGPQGGQGIQGLEGSTGITGMTGIQLHGNGSLIQCISQRGSVNVQLRSPPVLFTTFSPALTLNDNSSTISGQYENTGINFYGSPMNINTKTALTNTITMPAGRYYITAVVPVVTDPAVLNFSSIVLQLVVGSNNNDIRLSAPSRKNGILYLQTYYEPVETDSLRFSLRLRYDPQEPSDIDSGSFFKYMNAENPNASITIVKIW